MFFEIYKQGNLILRGRQILNTLSIDNELMVAPSTTMVLPISYLEVIDGREEIKIFLDDCRVFWAIVWDIEVDKENETIDLDLRHVVTEWQYRQISVNHAQSNKELNIVYMGGQVGKSESNDETITANNFSISLKEARKITIEQLVFRAGATAWRTSNGDKVSVASVKIEKCENNKCNESKLNKEGEYKVTFSTAKGTNVSVDLEVKAAVTYKSAKKKSNKSNKETITATPFSVLLSEAVNLSKDDVIRMAKIDAWVYRKPSQKIGVPNKSTTFEAKEGKYKVTASTKKGTSIEVNIEVINSGGDYSTDLNPEVVDKLEDIYNDKNFAYPGWQIEYMDDSKNRMIDYVYSRQNKLEALTRTMELTSDLWWRIGLWNEKKIQIGKFGEIKPYIISTKPSGATNIRLLTEPRIDYDFENVINVATVYSDKSDSGMSSVTLREIFNEPTLQQKEFPVVILHANVNNERNYESYIDTFPKLGNNAEYEYSIIDTVSVALESGTIIEGTFSFNDLSAFEDDGKIIPDEKRIMVAKTAYEAGIKKLIQLRRSYDVQITTEAIPCDLEVGDRVRFLYDNNLWETKECSSYWRKILTFDDLFYITKIEYNYDEYGNLTNDLTLTKWLKLDRETPNTIG